jgi:hypothetical protein
MCWFTVVQVKTLKLLRMLAEHGDDAAEAMNDILAQVLYPSTTIFALRCMRTPQ